MVYTCIARNIGVVVLHIILSHIYGYFIEELAIKLALTMNTVGTYQLSVLHITYI